MIGRWKFGAEDASRFVFFTERDERFRGVHFDECFFRREGGEKYIMGSPCQRLGLRLRARCSAERGAQD